MAFEKVTMLGPFPPISGGVSDYCLELAGAMAEELRIEFYTFRSIYPSFLDPGSETRNAGGAFTGQIPKGLEIRPVLSWYNPLGWLRAGIDAEGEVFHFQWWTFYLFFPIFTIALISKLRGRKIVCTVHNVLGHETGLIDRLFSSLVFLLPDKFIVHSKKNMAQLQKNFNVSPTAISVIPMGVFSLYGSDNVQRRGAREKLGIPQGAKVVLFFGIIRKYKGLEDLAEAFKISRKKVRGLFLLVAGNPWDRKLADEILGRLEGIADKKLVFGHVPSEEVKFLFAAADVVVLPYREFSSQSAAGSTALSFSKPLVVSDVGGLPELVLHKEAVFGAGNPGSLAATLETVFSKRGMLGGMARDSKKLRQKYSWHNACSATIALYRGLFG